MAAWLRASYGLHSGAPLIVNDTAAHAALGGRYEAFRGFAFYSGHYGRDIFEAVRDGHQTVTNFRDPVRRLVSLYNYFRFAVPDSETVRTHPAFGCVRAAKALGIEAFLLSDEPAVTLYTRNYHVRQLTWSGFEDRADLGAAKALVESMSWFFVAEDAEASLIRAAEWLGRPVPPIERLNQTSAHGERVEQLSSAFEEAVRDRNALDCALYDHAIALVRPQITLNSRRA